MTPLQMKNEEYIITTKWGLTQVSRLLHAASAKLLTGVMTQLNEIRNLAHVFPPRPETPVDTESADKNITEQAPSLDAIPEDETVAESKSEQTVAEETRTGIEPSPTRPTRILWGFSVFGLQKLKRYFSEDKGASK